VLAAKDRQALFIGEPEDIPDQKFGFLLPNKRDYAKNNYTFIGYIVRFDPQMYIDKNKIRSSLGYGNEPLIICSIGGTSVGKKLLELCNRAYPFIQQKIPDVKMVLVAGPRLSPQAIKAQPGVEVRGFVPDLFKHYAASDQAIAQGGFSSTSELTALRRPFIFFPIEGHSEAKFVAERLARYDAGIKMYYSKTTPLSLAEQVISSIGKPVDYKAMRVDGARRAAQMIDRYLS
jgi:predicted glycosyltransferase